MTVTFFGHSTVTDFTDIKSLLYKTIKNVIAGEDVMITLPDSKVKIAAITTNEELMIARDTMNIVQNEE